MLEKTVHLRWLSFLQLNFKKQFARTVQEQCESAIRAPKCVWTQKVINNHVWLRNTGIKMTSDLHSLTDTPKPATNCQKLEATKISFNR